MERSNDYLDHCYGTTHLSFMLKEYEPAMIVAAPSSPAKYQRCYLPSWAKACLYWLRLHFRGIGLFLRVVDLVCSVAFKLLSEYYLVHWLIGWRLPSKVVASA